MIPVIVGLCLGFAGGVVCTLAVIWWGIKDIGRLS